MSQEQRVLKAWWMTEMLQVPRVNEKKSSMRSVQLQGGVKLPWEKSEVKKEQKLLGYHIYIGIVPLKAIMTYIRDVFAAEEEFYQYAKEKSFMALVRVTKDGEYEFDSLQLPYMSAFLGKLPEMASDHGYKNFIDYFNTLEAELKTQFNQTFHQKRVCRATMQEMEALLIKMLKFPEHLLVQEEKGYLHDCVIERRYKTSAPSFINSFFAEELQMLLKKKVLPPALRAYLNGCETRTDFNEVREILEEWTDPSKIAPARWPAPTHYTLSLMQQVAVNVILSGDSPLDTVNGPPGTGKTTLLKDIFAARVFERAKAMIVFDDPVNAFTPMDKSFKIGNFAHRAYEVDSRIARYSMVVASSNNGAVENISKELPRRAEVMRAKNESFSAESQAREQEIANLAAEIDYFSALADGVSGAKQGESWGLFSVALGKSENNNAFASPFWFDTRAEHETMGTYLKSEGRYKLSDWQEAKEEFLALEKKIEERKAVLSQCASVLREYETFQARKKKIDERLLKMRHNLSVRKQQLAQLSQTLAENKEKLQTLSKVTFFSWFKAKRIAHKKELKKAEQSLTMLEQEMREVQTSLAEAEVEEAEIQRERDEWNEVMDFVADTLSHLRELGVTIPDNDYWTGSYEVRQKAVPWLSAELNHLRSKAFLLALKVHKIFLFLARKPVKRNLSVYFNRKQFDLNVKDERNAVKASWQTLFLAVPVVSTTFAAAGRLFCELDAEEIGELFIDEAGQAAPQAAAGMIYRAKHVVAVGDPLQVEPVVTVPQTLMNDICTFYNVDDAYVSASASVQTVADLGNPNGAEVNGKWIGLPLWVHRRCGDPMFTIANTIAYDNQMVLFTEKCAPHSRWLDVTGKAIRGQYVEAQGKMVEQLVLTAFTQAAEQQSLPDVYVITPFAIVKEEIKKKLRHARSELVRVSGKSADEVTEWIHSNIGTVHTFQGKEAKTVFFVVGTDEHQTEAANWIVSKPNLINVAVTRAKETIVIIGDQKRLSALPYFNVAFDVLEELEQVMV